MYVSLPLNINFSFNYGVIIMIIYVGLLITGFFSTFFYNNYLPVSFEKLIFASLNVFFFSLLRSCHNTLANLFFLFMFFHIFKSFFYSSSQVFYTFIIGVIIFLVSCGIAFFGYCLPMGQMSYWAAIVIFSLLSVLPFGLTIINYLFGSFSISLRTLSLLFFLHFIIPLFLFVLIYTHLLFLHWSLSSFTSFSDYKDLVFMQPIFIFVDFFIVILFFFLVFFIIFFFTFFFFESANFVAFNTLITPLHIYPDWFLLFPYACLRSVDSKLMGVFLLIFIMLGLFLLSFFSSYFKINSLFSVFVMFIIFIFFLIMFCGSFPSVFPFSSLIIYLQIIIYALFFFYFIFLFFLIGF